MSEILIRVNGSPVTRYEYNTVIQELALGHGGDEKKDRLPREELEQLAKERLVARELIYQAALAEGVVADEDEVVAECQRVFKGFRSEQDFLDALTRAEGDPVSFQRAMRKDITVARMSEKIANSCTPPDEAQIEGFYRQHRERLKKPACYDLRQLLLPCEDQDRESTRQRISQLKDRLGEHSFIELIRENSECPSAMQDGELCNVREEQMDPQLKQLLDDIGPGEVGGPVETASGFHLVEKLDFTPERVPELDECRAEIVAYLARESRSQALADWVEQLKKSAHIELT